MTLENYQDPEISTRIAQYEMAYRCKRSVPELTDLSKEPASTFELYGPDSRKPGSYAANCILARRLAERGVRFIQLFHPRLGPAQQFAEGDPRPVPADGPAIAALIQDLKQRGMLDDTLVVWGGEFGRTVYSQGTLTGRKLRSRPSPRGVSVSGWRAAASNAA
jgi:hypothetical protein